MQTHRDLYVRTNIINGLIDVRTHPELVFFVPIHRSYFCVRRTDGAARIYFSSLFIYPGTCHLMVEDYSRACQREREVRRKKKKKAQEKTTLP